MINDNILQFIIVLVLAYIFGNRIVPQLALICVTVVGLLSVATSPTIGLTTTNAYYVMLYAINVIYSVGTLYERSNINDA